MVDATRDAGDDDPAACDLIRDLDVRHGAASALVPERDTIEVQVWMTTTEVGTIRRLHRTLTRYRRTRRQTPGADDLMRELDRRLGAAQAAELEKRAAAGEPVTRDALRRGQSILVSEYDGDCGPDLIAGPPPAAPMQTPWLSRPGALAEAVGAFGGIVLAFLFYALVFRSWDTDRALVIWIGVATAVFTVGTLTGMRQARRAASRRRPLLPPPPFNDEGLPVELWDESEPTR